MEVADGSLNRGLQDMSRTGHGSVSVIVCVSCAALRKHTTWILQLMEISESNANYQDVTLNGKETSTPSEN